MKEFQILKQKLERIEREIKEVREILVKSEYPEDWENKIIEKREKEEEIEGEEVLGALDV